ncbi:hypothetical protein IEQ34_022543 [Dendrobium chrysotoxum]|uniref:Uncharacterized protein n=1 Tax=Dendrobium chrysotoxum TaxID=161865 RepID=A0AAV7FZC0_DENCH|nr:hypothetical protein IEQ34_022543 [Dendrobium chrysotoxum]
MASTHGSHDKQVKTPEDEQIEIKEQEELTLEQDVIRYNGPKEIFYEPEAEKFNNPKASLRAFEILKQQLMEPWMSWRDIPPDERERQWKYFLHCYSYIDEPQGTLLRRTWEDTIQRHVSHLLSQTHKVAKMGSSSKDISTWVDNHPKRIAKNMSLQMIDKWNIDAQNDRSQVAHSNHLMEGELAKHDGDDISSITLCNSMSMSQEKLPTQAELCNMTHMKKGTDEFIDKHLHQKMDDYAANFAGGCGDSFKYQGGVDIEKWMKDATNSRKSQLYMHTSNDVSSNFKKTTRGVHIDDSSKVQSRARLSQQHMIKVEQAVEIMLRYALDSFSDRLMPHIANQIQNSLRGKGLSTLEDDENEDEDDE